MAIIHTQPQLLEFCLMPVFSSSCMHIYVVFSHGSSIAQLVSLGPLHSMSRQQIVIRTSKCSLASVSFPEKLTQCISI